MAEFIADVDKRLRSVIGEGVEDFSEGGCAGSAFTIGVALTIFAVCANTLLREATNLCASFQ